MSVLQWEYNILVEKNVQLKAELENALVKIRAFPQSIKDNLQLKSHLGKTSKTNKNLKQKVNKKEKCIKELTQRNENLILRFNAKKKLIKSAKKVLSAFREHLTKIKQDLEKGVEVSVIITAIDKLLQSSEATQVKHVQADESSNSNEELGSDCEVVHETRTTPNNLKQASKVALPNEVAFEETVEVLGATQKESKITSDSLLQNKEATVVDKAGNDKELLESSVTQAKEATKYYVNDVCVISDSNKLSQTNADTNTIVLKEPTYNTNIEESKDNDDTHKLGQIDAVSDQVAKNILPPVNANANLVATARKDNNDFNSLVQIDATSNHIVLIADKINENKMVESIRKNAQKTVKAQIETDKVIKKNDMQNDSDVIEILQEETNPRGHDMTEEDKGDDMLLNNSMANVDINKEKDSNYLGKVNKRKNTDFMIDNHCKKVKKSYYSCNLCSKSFDNQFYLMKHKNTHKEKRFSCDSCGKSFMKKGLLILHNKWSDNFNTKCVKHKNNHENNIPNNIGTNSATVDESNKSVADFNGYVDKKQYAQEQKNVRNDLIIKRVIEPKDKKTVYSCDLCSKSFYKQCSLIKHKEKRHFTCNVCEKSFLNKEILILHQKKWHMGDNYVGHKNNPEISPYDISTSNDTVEDSNKSVDHINGDGEEEIYIDVTEDIEDDFTIESGIEPKKGTIRIKSLANLTEQPISNKIFGPDGIQTSDVQKSKIDEFLTADDGPEREKLAALKSLAQLTEISKRHELNFQQSLNHPQLVAQSVPVFVINSLPITKIQSVPVQTIPKPSENLCENFVHSELLDNEVNNRSLSNENNDSFIIADSFSCAEKPPGNFMLSQPLLDSEVNNIRLNNKNSDSLIISDSFSCAEKHPGNIVFLEKEQEIPAEDTETGSNIQPPESLENTYILINPNDDNINEENQSVSILETSKHSHSESGYKTHPPPESLENTYILISPNSANINEENQPVSISESSIHSYQTKKTITYSQALRNEVVRIVTEEQISPMNIAHRYGISAHTVREWVRKAGKKLPQRYKMKSMNLN